MSVLLSKPYSTFASGSTVDLDNATEAALVAQGLGTYVANPGSAFGTLSAAEQQKLRDGGLNTFSDVNAAMLLAAERTFPDGAPAGGGLVTGTLPSWLSALTYTGSSRNLAVWATAVAAGTARWAMWGTSITNGRNQNFYGATLYRLVQWHLRRAFPSLTLTHENFGIGGTTAAHALAYVSTTDFSFAAPAQTQYREEWQKVTATTAAKAWKTYIQDFGPDLIFVEFGLNDTVTSTYATGVQAIIDDIRSGGSWAAKRPSIVLIATHTGTDTTGVVYDNFQALRDLALQNGTALIDASRLYELLTTGIDPAGFPIITGEWVGLQYITPASGTPFYFDPVFWDNRVGQAYSPTGTTVRELTSGAAFRTLRKRSTRDGAVQGRFTSSASTGVLSIWYRVDPTDANYSTNTGKAYEMRISTTTVQVYFRASGGSLVAISGAVLTLSPGTGTNTTFAMRVDFRGGWHRITVYEGTGTPQVLEFFDYQYLGAGYSGYGISGASGGFITLGTVGNQTTGCILEFWDRPPAYGAPVTDAVLLNTVNDFTTNVGSYGGNAVNHLTGPAHRLVFDAAIGLVMRQLQDAA